LVTTRRGMGSLGCLFSLLILAAIAYFGDKIGTAYWRFYQFQDDMRQDVNFAGRKTNDQILAHLRASADSLGLPDDAKRVSIRRTERTITIESDYDEQVELPLHSRELHFHPHAEGTIDPDR
jgi:hypothetical protein